MEGLTSCRERDGTIEDTSTPIVILRDREVHDKHQIGFGAQSRAILTNAPPPNIPPSYHDPPLLHRSHIYQGSNETRQNADIRRNSALVQHGNLGERRRNGLDTAKALHSQGRDSSSYHIRGGQSGEQFYVPGKVFSTLWSEPRGEGAHRNPVASRSSNYSHSSGSSDANVYTNIAYFIVLKVHTKFCVCLRMSTYAYQGLKSPKLTEPECQAHAVAYSNPEGPDTEDNERTQQQPIAVRPFHLDRQLNPKSRIYLAKPFSVERNLKVKERGDVVDFELLKRITQPYLSL